MKSLAWLALPLIAACATPSDIRRDGARYEYTLKLPPGKAAACMARNVEESSGGIAGHAREGAAAGTFEVIARVPDGPFMVADVVPSGSGSKATVWRGSMPIFPRDLHTAMAKGC